MTKKTQSQRVRPIDKDFRPAHTEIMLQLSGNNNQPEAPHASLVDLRKGDAAILDRIDLPTEDARRLMELGFVPGTRITAGNSAPGGDPRVFQVDGSGIGLRQKVANFPGVTVEQHTGIAELPDGRGVSIIDLPGIYSLNPRSEDEQVAYDVLHGERAGTPKPEAVLLVLDSTNLGRHLMLAAPILALGLPTLIILNMADDLRSRGGKLDLRKLSHELGAPVTLI